MSDEVFSVDIPDIQQFIKELNLLDESVQKAVNEALNKGADMITQEQRRLILGQSKTLSDKIAKGRLKISKKGNITISTGYQKDTFQEDADGNNWGIIGTMFEFGRPGESSNARSKTTMTQIRNGKEVEVLKGKIDAESHIRRGFDNKIAKASQVMIDSVERELSKFENGGKNENL